jgi:hypothetical protein
VGFVCGIAPKQHDPLARTLQPFPVSTVARLFWLV